MRTASRRCRCRPRERPIRARGLWSVHLIARLACDGKRVLSLAGANNIPGAPATKHARFGGDGMNYTSLPLGEKAPTIVNAIIEVPGGQANKYEFDKSLLVFRLDRPLYASVHYPGDYGFIPSTLGRDGDPLDVLVLLPHPTFSGCLVEVRPLGVLEMLDQGVPDEKVLGTAVHSPSHRQIRDHSDLEPHVLREIEHFFAVYKELEGKHTEVRGWKGASVAYDLIRAAHESFLSPVT